MKSADSSSVTSLPQSPHEEARARTARYMLTMGVRVACLLLMVLVTPHGWYTWVFAFGAAVLPYFAVVCANAVGSTSQAVAAESPTLEISSPAEEAVSDAPPQVITIREKRGESPT